MNAPTETFKDCLDGLELLAADNIHNFKKAKTKQATSHCDYESIGILQRLINLKGEMTKRSVDFAPVQDVINRVKLARRLYVAY